MLLRCRRSLPTENARSPAPVMTTQRTLRRTATSSRTSVSRAPISVVMALSASASYSSRIGSARSSTVDAGGPKSRTFQRSVPAELVLKSASPCCRRSCLECSQPVERAQAGHEAVLATARDHERRQLLQSTADRAVRDREPLPAVVGSGQGVPLVRGTDEHAVVEPLRLDELE